MANIKKPTYNDFVRMVEADMRVGSAPDEHATKEQIRNTAQYYYAEYLKSGKVEELFSS